jgi:cysteine desulfurase/selenocysteine lyase
VLEFVELAQDGNLDLVDLKNKLNNQVAILAVTHVSNVLGTVNPIDRIVKMAHKVNALVLVDSAQSIARLPINVKKNKVDFLVFSGHKMYGPLGIGVLYGRRELLEKMEPFMLGGDMVTTVTRKSATWNNLPWKFEAGTPNIAGGVALGMAVDFIKSVGIPSIWQHEQELVEYVISKLLEIEGLVIVGLENVGEHLSVLSRGRTQRSSPTTKPLIRAGVISFTVDGIHSHDLVTLLDAEGIAVRAGHHCVQPLLTTLGIKECTRISFSVTTTLEELDRFITVLGESVKILKR